MLIFTSLFVFLCIDTYAYIHILFHSRYWNKYLLLFYKLFLISVKISVSVYYMYSTNYAMTSRMLYNWGKSCSRWNTVADKETDVGKI